MKKFNKRILLSVTGMSPAVVTETLFALITEKHFIPTEIQIITTLQGKTKVLESLLGIVGGRKEKTGALESFVADYGQQYGFEHIYFDESCIHIIEENQKQLADIRTPQQNQQAADQIVALVGNLCGDEQSQLHVSIAGGRKTMGFFIGYALSLYGREQDSLSHVLVEERFENLPNFFYPKPYPHIINDLKGNELDASQAQVMLAEIPWVRLGLGISDELRNNKISYSESIEKAQSLLSEPRLTFCDPIDDREVIFGDKKIKLSPRGYSLLLSLVYCKLHNKKFGISGNLEKDSISIYKSILSIWRDYDDDTIGLGFSSLVNDSRTDINKKVRTTFSLGKSAKTVYIPYSNNCEYNLDINPDNIDISAIKSDLNHIIK